MIKNIFINHKLRLNRKIACAVSLLVFSCCLTLFCYFSLKAAKSAQKMNIVQNALAYSTLMDERISVDLYYFMDINLNPELESSILDDFFVGGISANTPGGFSKIQEVARECVEMAENLEGLILYRASDNTLLSTLSDYHYLAKINPAYPYLMSAIAQVNGDAPSFVHYSNGTVLYYYPISYANTTEDFSAHVHDCAIAILRRSEDFLGVTLSPSSSLATCAVLKEGQILSVEGYNPLSHKLVASIAGLAKSSSPLVYTYEDPNLSDYYFYLIPSQSSELDYCYYEPVLTGWPLIQAAFPLWRVLVVILFFGILWVNLYFLIAGSSKRTEKKTPKAPVPPEPENSFGSLLNYSGIIIDYFNKSGNVMASETLDMHRMNRIICENFAFNKIAYQASPRHHGDYLEYHINYNSYNMRVLSDSLKMNLYNEMPEYPINIFYSNPVSTRQEMEDDLFYLRKHLHYSLVLGYKIRLSIDQIKTFEKNTEILDANVTGTIQGFLRTGAYEDFYAYMNHYKDITTVYAHSYNFMTWYSFSERYRFAEEAFTTVKLFFQENGFSHPIANATCNSVLRTRPGFNHLCEYLISCVQSYQQENQHTLSDRNQQIMSAIYKFINEDLAGASLSSIARKMQMTDSHLSRVFKKNTGFNFSEYLSERRLEEAAKLLLQDTKLKVADVSDQLGYGNPTYFLSRFKAKYGVSPSAYRKSHLTEKKAPPNEEEPQ